MKRLMATLLLLVTVAGCVDDNADSEPVIEPTTCPESPFEHPEVQILNITDDPIVDERELAWDFSTYNVRTCDLFTVGHTPLRWAADGAPDPHGYIGEIDIKAEHDLAAVAALGAGPERGTAYLLDISDRANPQVLSSIEQGGTYLVDVKISPDGRYLAAASQTAPSAELLEGVPPATLGAELTSNYGFTLYDIRDPSNPSYMMTYPDLGTGCHMLSFVIIQDTHVIACVSDVLKVWGFVEAAPGTLVPLGFVPYVPTDAGTGLHDMTISYDDVTGAPTMAVSRWENGVDIVDLSNAPQAEFLGNWAGQGATHWGGNLHTAMMFYADGTRYVMASPEYTSGGNVPSLWVLDATDYGNMNLVGEWYHPNEHDSQGLFLTTHQWQVAPTGPDVPLEDVHVYLTMNHGGVWVLGFKEMLEGDLWGAIKGFHLTRTPLDEATAVTANAVLNTWDVNLVDGYIYGTDRATGVWVLDYRGDDHLTDLTGFA